LFIGNVRYNILQNIFTNIFCENVDQYIFWKKFNISSSSLTSAPRNPRGRAARQQASPRGARNNATEPCRQPRGHWRISRSGGKGGHGVGAVRRPASHGGGQMAEPARGGGASHGREGIERWG
jgi:hypothetical protein